MKTTILCLFCLLAVAPARSAPKAPAAAVWEITEGLAQPESAWFDAPSGSLFISNVAGSPGERDGQGWIMKADAKGQVDKVRWVEGLNAPKGLRSHGGKLYVADIDELVEIDIAAAAVARRLKAPGALMLNDVAVDGQGNVYASDTLGSSIYRFTPRGEVFVFAQGPQLESPNGLCFFRDKLYVAAWGLAKPDWSTSAPGRLLAVDVKTKDVAVVGGPSGHLDGLERWKGGWLVSDFMAGSVFFRDGQGKVRTLYSGFQGAADLGLLPGGLLVLPKMQENKVSAYALK